jgi:hypothetical protein
MFRVMFLPLADTNSDNAVIKVLFGISLLVNIIGLIIVCIICWRKRNTSKQPMEMVQHPQTLFTQQLNAPSTSNHQDHPISVEYDEINEAISNVTSKPADDGYLQPITTQAGPSRIQPSVTTSNIPVNAGDPGSQYADVLNLENKQEVGEYHYILHKGRKI